MYVNINMFKHIFREFIDSHYPCYMQLAIFRHNLNVAQTISFYIWHVKSKFIRIITQRVCVCVWRGLEGVGGGSGLRGWVELGCLTENCEIQKNYCPRN